MNIDQIQPHLMAIIGAIAALDGAPGVVLIDDGLQNAVMEGLLQDAGIAILVMTPQAVGLDDSARGAVRLEYSAAVWVRTNPKVKRDNASVWNPLTIEGQVITAVLQWSKQRADLGFKITPGAPPETDWYDTGNNSRLIRFSTPVGFH